MLCLQPALPNIGGPSPEEIAAQQKRRRLRSRLLQGRLGSKPPLVIQRKEISESVYPTARYLALQPFTAMTFPTTALDYSSVLPRSPFTWDRSMFMARHITLAGNAGSYTATGLIPQAR